jgi:hypothetical protein
MTSNDTNTNALSEKSYECGSGAGMKHINFYLDGLEMTVVGKKDGMPYIQKANLRVTSRNNGGVEIVANMETGNE